MQDDLHKLKINQNTINKLKNNGINSIKDLVYFYPYKYIDRTNYFSIIDVLNFSEKSNYHSIGYVKSIKVIDINSKKSKKKIIKHTIEDETAYIDVLWFNALYILNYIKEGDKVVFSGKVYNRKLYNPIIRKINDNNELDVIKDFANIEPVYSELSGVKSRYIRRLIKKIFDYNLYYEFDFLSDDFLIHEGLLEINQALKIIHFPQNRELLNKAKHRLAFNEIYSLIQKTYLLREKINSFHSFKFNIDYNLHYRLINNLGFKLTKSQENAINEIYNDLQKNIPMHRLLVGDVGSGKTIVAIFALLQALANNKQGVLLAPTGILATQHYDFLVNLLNKNFLNFNIHLVTSDNKKINNHNNIFIFDSGTHSIFVGTHALIYNTEILNNVGLVVIDEQHKFGVKQREILEQLNSSYDNLFPHVLSMSATPIPRSLALTLYSDFDVSFIEKPLGRKKVITRIIENDIVEEKMLAWLYLQMKNKKAQVYVVCPSIENNEKLNTKSVMQEYNRYKSIFPDLNVNLLHGKLSDSEKEEIIRQFNAGYIDILISTTVIEVGINNPNATVVIIEGAERFGLSQLHQIRGRVGRSYKQSYCFIKTSNHIYNEKLKFFESNDDGFKISEFDLELRGPGEIWGVEQTGIPNLKFAKFTDIDIINKAKRIFEILNQ